MVWGDSLRQTISKKREIKKKTMSQMSNHDLKDINTSFYWQAFKEALMHCIDNQSSSKLYIGNKMIPY